MPVPDEQSVNGESSYWLFHTVGGTQVYRRIYLSCDARHASRTVGDDRALSAWRSLKDVKRVDAVLPVPDLRRVDGKTQCWLFHTTAQGRRYRLISIADGGMHTDEAVRSDRDLTQWTSLRGVTKVDAFHFVPGKYRMNGQTWTWVFHNQQYRLISIADGFGHADTLLREDRPNTAWFRGA